MKSNSSSGDGTARNRAVGGIRRGPAPAWLSPAWFLCFALWVGGGFTRPAPANEIHVPGDYPRIQDAINAAVDGDQVWVAPGRYEEKLNLHGKAILLSGEDPENPDNVAATVVDADGFDAPVIICAAGETEQCVVRGLTLMGGTGWLIGQGRHGNRSTVGGGIFCRNAAPTFEYCQVRENWCLGHYGDGAGVYCGQGAQPTFYRCRFVANAAEKWGSIVYVSDPGSSLRASECCWQGNSSDRISTMTMIWVHAAERVELVDCLLEDNDNTTYVIFPYATELLLERCIIRGNDGCLLRADGQREVDEVVVRNCIITDNRDASNLIVSYGGAFTIDGCTFADNATTSATISLNYGTTAEITHSIFWNDPPGTWTISYDPQSFVAVSYCDIWGEWGHGNLFADPLFASWNGNDYWLAPGSPCIDAGARDRVDAIPWPARLDNGRRADLGAFGGPWAAGWRVWRADGDGQGLP